MVERIKIGILGGTFDPIHFGHLRVAEEVGENLNLNKVLLIPVNIPPHKRRHDLTPFNHRFQMTKLAVKGSTILDVSDIERKRGGISYTVDTLRDIKKLWHEPEVYFIIGMDAFLDIKTWKEYKELFSLCHFVVIKRPGFAHGSRIQKLLITIDSGFKRKSSNFFISIYGFNIILMKTTLMDISSTRIRELASEGKSMRFLLPDSVIKYIVKEGLYRLNGYSEKGISLS